MLRTMGVSANDRNSRRGGRWVAAGMAAAAVGVAGTVLVVVLGHRPGRTSSSETSVVSHPGPSPRTDELLTPARQERAVRRVARLGLPVYRGGPRGRYVALTFDDGPGPLTATALRVLGAVGAHATFFVVGSNVARWSALLAQEAALGAVGDHTWSHPYLPHLPHASQMSQLRRGQAAAAQATGRRIELFRPPYGGLDRVIDGEVRRLGMLEVLWSVDSGDSGGADWRGIMRNVRAGLRPGAIILFHENRGETLKALNRLLPEIRSRGFIPVSVPELLALDPPDLAQIRADARSLRTPPGAVDHHGRRRRPPG